MNIFKLTTRRVLVIGDLHEPFCVEGYREHCKKIYKKYRCNEVVFIGDIIDNHFSSYHETVVNSYGGGHELKLAKERLSKWYKQFPKATVIIGNHDRLVSRKAQTGGIPSEWIRCYSDVLAVPKWDFMERLVIDNVQYVHGEAGTARTKCKTDMMNTVQGHLHTQCYVEIVQGIKNRLFGMQVGCGVDKDTYAMAYAKSGKTPALACGVVLDGTTAIVEPMNF